jgi:hypothetical protein
MKFRWQALTKPFEGLHQHIDIVEGNHTLHKLGDGIVRGIRDKKW